MDELAGVYDVWSLVVFWKSRKSNGIMYNLAAVTLHIRLHIFKLSNLGQDVYCYRCCDLLSLFLPTILQITNLT